ncbi:MAG TPA: glycoside hydrolase family 2 TIM barrel-domain containing protein [Bacteroidales bacterium]|nr:glycoside hydrolase family 2 TIM barrel-domain containing protein [Bacteroidales bacterium]
MKCRKVIKIKRSIFNVLFLILVGLGIKSVNGQNINFNKDWLFLNKEQSGAENPGIDDSGWRKLDLPHDWAIEGPFDVKYNARCGGLPFHGTGWYRKHFVVPQSESDKVVRIEFEGVMYDAYVWVNGVLVGNRPYGYIGFEFDISKYLKYNGSENVIAVRVTPKDLSSRWYPGAGIYRSVWLKIDEPVHVAQYGTFITTPTVNDVKAVVQNETTVENKGNTQATIQLKHNYYSPEGHLTGSVEEQLTVEANSIKVSGLYCNIENPVLWDMDSPKLYKAVTTVSENGKVLDTYETRFGIRRISYSTEGFFLNGKKVRFNGVCLHHDNGALGAAVYRRADEHKLQIMKEMGANAIRTSHNPPSRELLELCDELGLLVMDESFDVWRMAKVVNGYNIFFDEWSERDQKDMIRRDRNHPSVVMWSIGNEMLEQGDQKYGWKEAKRLADFCREMDRTRPVVAGYSFYPDPFDYNMVQQTDIAGMNYKPSLYSEVHKNYPDIPVVGSETSSCVSSRGVYHLPVEKYQKHESLQISSYDLIAPPWAYPPDLEFHFQEENPFVMGEFIWTGFDYLGEPTPYGGKDNSTHGKWNADWPARSSYFGAVDLCGFPKDRFYLYQSQWTSKPMIHLLPHWNWEGMEGKEIPVYCYTNCDEAELFVNCKSLGKRVKGKDLTEIPVESKYYNAKTFQSKYRLSWNVPYQAGTIKVVGYKNGQATVEEQITTARKPAKISLAVDRSEIEADGLDLAYVSVRIEDKDGNLCPMADNLVYFETSGAGKLIAVDNGNAATTESFQANYRKAFSGKCLAILKSSEKAGVIVLEARSKGLKEANVVVLVK